MPDFNDQQLCQLSNLTDEIQTILFESLGENWYIMVDSNDPLPPDLYWCDDNNKNHCVGSWSISEDDKFRFSPSYTMNEHGSYEYFPVYSSHELYVISRITDRLNAYCEALDHTGFGLVS